MRMEILCPFCAAVFSTEAVHSQRWSCPACQREIVAQAGDAELLTHCRVCGNQEMYLQKNFPQRLGLAILVAAFALSCVFYYWHWLLWTWAVLIGSVILDVILYWWVGVITVCYRCQTRYYGFLINPQHLPFELEIAERYRQERLRRQAVSRGRE